MRNARRAFTLVELLLVVGLVGLIVVVGMVPLVHTVGLLSGVERDFGEEGALRLAASRMTQDLRQVVRPPQGAVAFRLLRRDRLGGAADDVVLVYGTAPLGEGKIVGSVVYRLIWPDQTQEIAGLYRWFLGGVLPSDVDPDALIDEDGKLRGGELVLPGVDSCRVEAHDGSTWVGQTEGAVPLALSVRLGRKEEKVTYVDWFPR